VKSEEVDERMVLDVMLVRAREMLKVYWARKDRGAACICTGHIDKQPNTVQLG
jgi:hypothetical protein